jgi:hypothetical protein
LDFALPPDATGEVTLDPPAGGWLPDPLPEPGLGRHGGEAWAIGAFRAVQAPRRRRRPGSSQPGRLGGGSVRRLG